MILDRNSILTAVRNKEIEISPFDEKQIGPNSYDLRLAKQYGVSKKFELDAAEETEFSFSEIPSIGMTLWPGNLYLMHTVESTYTKEYVPCIEGRSSVGRLGINIHSTAGFGDLGFSGTWTLEVSCVQPVKIYSGMRICQIFFMQPKFEPNQIRPHYSGKYLSQNLPKVSGLFKEKDEWDIAK